MATESSRSNLLIFQSVHELSCSLKPLPRLEPPLLQVVLLLHAVVVGVLQLLEVGLDSFEAFLRVGARVLTLAAVR